MSIFRQMKLIIGLILFGILTQTALGKSIVKRDCCCDSYNDCDSSCSVPCNYRQTNNCNNGGCNRGRNCEENNSCYKPDNKDTVPVLIPFPQPQEAQNYPNNPTVTNNTNINNNTIELTLTNTINTVNNVSVPISVNSTNENTITVYLTSKKEESEVDSNFELDEIRQSKCCIVSSTSCDQNNKCVTQRHRECSDVCSGFYNIVDSTSTPILKLQNNTQSTTIRPYPLPLPQPIPLPLPQPIPLPLPQPIPLPLPQPIPFPLPQPIPLPLPQPIPLPLPQPSPQPLPLPLPQPLPRPLPQPQPILPPQCGVYVMGCQQQLIQPGQPTMQKPSGGQQNYGMIDSSISFNQPQNFRQLFTLQQEQQQQSLPQQSVQAPQLGYTVISGQQQTFQPYQSANQKPNQDIIQPECEQYYNTDHSQQFTEPQRFRQFYTVQQQPHMFYSVAPQQLGYTVSSGQQQSIQPPNQKTFQAITLPRYRQDYGTTKSVYPYQQFTQPQNSRQVFTVQPNILQPQSIKTMQLGYTQKSGQYVQPPPQQQEQNSFHPQLGYTQKSGQFVQPPPQQQQQQQQQQQENIFHPQLGYTQKSGQFVQPPSQQQQEQNIFNPQLGYTQNSEQYVQPPQVHPTFYPYQLNQNEQSLNNIQYNPYLRVAPSSKYN